MLKVVNFSEIDNVKLHRFSHLFLSAHEENGDMVQDHSSVATVLVDGELNPGLSAPLADGFFAATPCTFLDRTDVLEVRDGIVVEFSEGEETAISTELTISDLDSLWMEAGILAPSKIRGVDNQWQDISERRIPGR